MWHINNEIRLTVVSMGQYIVQEYTVFCVLITVNLVLPTPVLFSLKKEENSDACYSMDKF